MPVKSGIKKVAAPKINGKRATETGTAAEAQILQALLRPSAVPFSAPRWRLRWIVCSMRTWQSFTAAPTQGDTAGIYRLVGKTGLVAGHACG